MKISVEFDDDLLETARCLTGLNHCDELIEESLRILINKHVAAKLIALGGTMPDIECPPRRRVELDENGSWHA